KGTRSMDGLPGKKYWQNHGKYTMDITVNATTKIVSGIETIVYENNSSDTLKNMPIRFVNNLHKPSSPRGGSVSEDFLSNGLTITSLKINGEVYKEDARKWGTVGNVKMKKPLVPKSKATLEIDWNYPLSKESGREGQIDNTTFFAAYSYPRVTVLDDYNGWDMLPHTDRQEFYNDFNDYVYTVKAPKNYVVYGTGDLLNPDEVLQPEFAARLKKSYTTDEILHIANEQELDSISQFSEMQWFLNNEKKQLKELEETKYLVNQPYQIKLQTKEGLCVDETEKEVIPYSTDSIILIPNVFTPNNDGFNDCLYVQGITLDNECNSLKVFNRWGQVMFNSETEGKCWNGIYENKPVSSGVYFFILKNKDKNYHGTITLVR
ncbi:MAG: gliding motility-associated C-terminal domain-containing protein, partial [Candidatus Methylacidiphilales bacterium]